MIFDKEKIVQQLDVSNSRAHLISILVIIFIGLLLRHYGYWMGGAYHYFSINDEISAYRVALDFLSGKERAYYIGQPIFSKGFAPGPGWTLFWAAAYKLGGNSVENALFIVTLLNTLVIFLVYRIARQFCQPVYALLAMLLYATFPWPVYFANGLWNPIPLALLGSLLVLSLWRVFQTEQSRAILIVASMAAIIPHFHMIGVFYFPVILLLLYFSPKRINKKWLALGVIAGVCIYLPYIIGESMHGWENTRAILSGDKGFSFSVLKILSAPVTVLSSLPGRWTGDDINEFYQFGNQWFGHYGVLAAVSLLSMLISFGLLLRFFVPYFAGWRQGWKKPSRFAEQQPALFFIGTLILLPLILFTVTGHNYSTRYTIIILPLLFVLPVIYLQKTKSSWFKRLVSYSLPLMIVFNVYLLLAFYTHQGRQIESGEYLVSTFKKMEQLRKQIQAHAGPQQRIELEIKEYSSDTGDKKRIAATALKSYLGAYQNHANNIEYTASMNYKLVANTGQSLEAERIAYRDQRIIIYRQ